ncbi:MAG: hydrogenase nickel incorporation protein HypB [Candidatus Altiarchaeota archaeon]|nr:hydrogenase nickel incorporation protein HypB [Candidatus Altiarchaeota archaeon]
MQDKKQKEKEIIRLQESVNRENDETAEKTNRFLTGEKIFCINLMGSPGSGKTAFIEGLTPYIKPSEMAVIQGDLESDIDKKRLQKKKILAYQINTHGGCHLNAFMVADAVRKLKLRGKKYLVIENVGNLVCPAGIPLGQHINALVSSTAEGTDKPRKYDIMFMDADLIAISKYDLRAAVGFRERQYVKDIRRVNKKAQIIKTSIKDRKTFASAAKYIISTRNALLG